MNYFPTVDTHAVIDDCLGTAEGATRDRGAAGAAAAVCGWDVIP